MIMIMIMKIATCILLWVIVIGLICCGIREQNIVAGQVWVENNNNNPYMESVQTNTVIEVKGRYVLFTQDSGVTNSCRDKVFWNNFKKIND